MSPEHDGGVPSVAILREAALRARRDAELPARDEDEVGVSIIGGGGGKDRRGARRGDEGPRLAVRGSCEQRERLNVGVPLRQMNHVVHAAAAAGGADATGVYAGLAREKRQ